ncbi:fumarate hydratase class I, aerobic-like [Watersipora subatra]|uniref:fumarate hydratase class I, aerobic-like n=1 Tax=Watersipora subatra TaxID=2589382 RepID=UPI00355B921B
MTSHNLASRSAQLMALIICNLNKPMSEILSDLSKHPVKTRLSLTGTLVVARDIAHAKLKERLDNGEGMPDYMLKYPVYYAGPAKTPEDYACGSFGPTTAGRIDSCVEEFQAGGSGRFMLAKGYRKKAVKFVCKTDGGFYLGSIGGTAAVLAQNNIKKVEMLEYPELGYVSERHDAHGSFFIRALVEVFYKHSCHRDVKRLFEEQITKKVRAKSIDVNNRYPRISRQQPNLDVFTN